MSGIVFGKIYFYFFVHLHFLIYSTIKVLTKNITLKTFIAPGVKTGKFFLTLLKKTP